MTVVAVTPIRHGNDDGTVTVFGVGENVSGVSEDYLRTLVEGGSAVETGKEKKFNSPYYNPSDGSASGVVDDDTRKRDALIAGLLDGAPEGLQAPLLTENGEQVTTADLTKQAAQQSSGGSGAPAPKAEVK